MNEEDVETPQQVLQRSRATIKWTLRVLRDPKHSKILQPDPEKREQMIKTYEELLGLMVMETLECSKIQQILLTLRSQPCRDVRVALDHYTGCASCQKWAKKEKLVTAILEKINECA